MPTPTPEELVGLGIAWGQTEEGEVIAVGVRVNGDADLVDGRARSEVANVVKAGDRVDAYLTNDPRIEGGEAIFTLAYLM